jgi:hypothetical protein
MRILFLFFAMALQAKTVYFVDIGGIDSSKYFYDWTFYRDEVSKPMVLLREAIEKAGFTVKFTSNCKNLTDVAAVISINDATREVRENLSQHPKEKLFLLIMEPPIVMPELHNPRIQYPFGKIFDLFDHRIDGRTFFKLYYPQPRLKMIEEIPDYSQKKLCVMINGNKNFEGPGSLYAERRKVISFLTDIGAEFDLYGPDWGGYSAWRGPAAAKWETLKNYKFNFCYENSTNQKGYITEKIFDAMVGGCVPIYLGADNVTDYIPEECFIDRRRFTSDGDLYSFITHMDGDVYQSYLAAISRFLESEKAHVFSSEYFVQMILQSVLEAQ